MSEKMEKELADVRKWACCSEPEMRVIAEHALKNMKSEITRLRAIIDGLECVSEFCPSNGKCQICRAKNEAHNKEG